MAAREFHGIIHNTWDTPLFRVADDCDSGQWQDPWYPSKIPGAGKIDPQQSAEWRSESCGFMTGTSGWARWGISVLEISEGVEHFEFVQVNWSIPFNQVFSKVNITCAVFRNDPDPKDNFARPDPRPSILALIPWRQNADGTLALPTGEDDSALGLTQQAGSLAATGGDLMWARHTGRADGSFNWDGPLKKVGTGWGRLNHVFSGGDGIIYAITPVVPASLSTGIGTGFTGSPASGGDLMWARHTGRADGSFNWDGPLKKVGTGWGDLLQVFSGD